MFQVLLLYDGVIMSIHVVSDASSIGAVINAAAEAYRAIMGPDFNPADYMSTDQVSGQLKLMTFFGMNDGETLVAVIGYQPLSGLALVRHAYVLPAYQRQGIGRSLLAHIEKAALSHGLDRLLVGTYAANADAIKFYRHHGFDLVDNSRELLASYWDVPQWQAAKSLVMEKTLVGDQACPR